MARGGYIKLHRSIIEWEWFRDSNTYRLFTYLLMVVNHEPNKWQGITIDRGQRVTSCPNLALELQLTIQQTRTALEHLKSTGEITVKTTNKYSLITVNNYAKYQARDDDGALDESNEVTDNSTGKSTDQQQTNNARSNKRITTNKNDKNIRNKEDIYTTPLPPSKNIPFQEIVDLYNEECVELPKATRLTEARKRAIRAQWTEHGDMATFKRLFNIAAESPFLNGSNTSGWRANFDWLLNPRNFMKVLEGNYEARMRASPGVNGMWQGPLTIAERNNAVRDRSLRNIAKYLKELEEGKDGGDNSGVETSPWKGIDFGGSLLPGKSQP